MHVTKHKAGYDRVQINHSKIAMLNNKAPLDILMLYLNPGWKREPALQSFHSFSSARRHDESFLKHGPVTGPHFMILMSFRVCNMQDIIAMSIN